MLKTTKHLLAMSIIAISTNAMSKDISYDYVQGTYSSITDDSLGVDIDGDGFAVSGSFSVSPNIAVTALLGSTSYDRIAGIDIDSNEFDFGITAHTSIAPNTSVFGNFSIVNAEVEASDSFTTISDDDTGNAISVGIRHMASENIEIGVGLSRADIFDDTANTFGFGARFYANEKFSIGVGYRTGDDVAALLLNARIDIK
ncbi:MAG: outer membrane beta-barrel protein [Gammaproteobacteria bacterium]|nr:outer membrane beta-barrel protein [Gammaproteobacteria bacterium]